MTVEHALSCAKGGFPTIRHNEIRDLTANLLTEVCNDVRIEPDLQPVMPQQLSGATANAQDGARLDISANGVWGGRFEKTYFDVRVFNPHAPSNKNMTLSASYRKHEREKKRAYDQRVREVNIPPSPHSFYIAATGGKRGNIFLQAPSLKVVTEMGHTLQHHTLLPAMSFGLLSPTQLNPGHQRCQVLHWTPSKTTELSGSGRGCLTSTCKPMQTTAPFFHLVLHSLVRYYVCVTLLKIKNKNLLVPPRYAEHADRLDCGKPSRPLCICIYILAFSRSSFATEQFQRKPFEGSDLHCPLSRSYPL